jgi:hypothetical protein
MKDFGFRRSVITLCTLCTLAGACGSGTAPTPAGYEGQWNGTTAQGSPITFTISPDEAVTTITVAHNFSGCSGSQTFSNLSLSIAPTVICIPGPCTGSLASFRTFAYMSGDRIEGPSTEVHAVFPSTSSAEGTVNFRSYPGCGSAIGVAWAAARR